MRFVMGSDSGDLVPPRDWRKHTQKKTGSREPVFAMKNALTVRSEAQLRREQIISRHVIRWCARKRDARRLRVVTIARSIDRVGGGRTIVAVPVVRLAVIEDVVDIE